MSVGTAHPCTTQRYIHEARVMEMPRVLTRLVDAAHSFIVQGIALAVSPFTIPNLYVAKLDGTLFKIELDRLCSVIDVKKSVEASSGIKTREQRLLLGTREVQDHEKLEVIIVEKCTTLTLIRRPVIQAEWLEIVRERPLDLQGAPDEARGDAEVVLAAGCVNPQALNFAAADLWRDKAFILEAVQYNWLVWLHHVPPELSSDREVVLAVLAQHARALKHLPRELCRDPEIILAALHRIPELASIQPLQMLLTEHASFVFLHAATELRHNCEFMMAAMDKDWHTNRFAAPDLWSNHVFVLAAVRHSGDLLEKASDALRADPEIVRAAVEQDNRALRHASSELISNREFMPEISRGTGRLPDGMAAGGESDKGDVLKACQQILASCRDRELEPQRRRAPPPQPVDAAAVAAHVPSVNGMCGLYAVLVIHACFWLWFFFFAGGQPKDTVQQNG